jgi:hypothetical protein
LLPAVHEPDLSALPVENRAPLRELLATLFDAPDCAAAASTARDATARAHRVACALDALPPP